MKKIFKQIRYLLEYIIFLVVLKALRFLSIDNSAELCSRLARKVGPLLKVTRIARANLNERLDENIEANKILDQLWDNFGRFIGEFPHSFDLSRQELERRIEVTGLEHLKTFQLNKKPFLLFTGHFANWDLLLSSLTILYPKFAVVYRRANNPYVDKVIAKVRSGPGIILIEKGTNGAKNLVKAIKDGYSIVMLVDQKMNDGIAVPFLGKEAMTSQGIAKLALQYDYPIVPCQIIRTGGSYFKEIIYPALQFEKTNNNDKDCYNIMLQINKHLETWVKSYPSQWFWFHNRWGKVTK